MMKKIQKNKSLLIIGIVLIALVVTFGFNGIVKADISLKELIAEKIAIILGDKLSEELDLTEGELSLGVAAQPNRYDNGYWDVGHGYYVDGTAVITADGGLRAEPTQGFGIGTIATDGTITDGYRFGVLTVTLNNTSTLAVVNPESDYIYVYNAAYTIQTATTTAYRAIAGTTTQAFIEQDGSSLTVGHSWGDQSIFDTGTTEIIANASPDTATSTFWKADFEGVDTRDGSGTRYVIPVAPTEYLSCYASTTDNTLDIGTFGGQCTFFYYVLID